METQLILFEGYVVKPQLEIKYNECTHNFKTERF